MMTSTKNETLNALEYYGTADVCDSMSKLGYECYIPGIQPLTPLSSPVAGRAHTTRLVLMSDAEPALTVNHIDSIADYDTLLGVSHQPSTPTDPSEIIALVQTPPDCAGAMFGGLKLQRCEMLKTRAFFTNGKVRDTASLIESDVAVFHGGTSSMNAKKLLKIAEVGGELVFGQVVVKHGDFLLGDTDGVVCVPSSVVEQMLSLCSELELVEDMMVNDLLRGSTLAQVIAEYR